MPNTRSITFTRLADGTLLRRRSDGTFQPVQSKSSRTRVAQWTDAETGRPRRTTGASFAHLEGGIVRSMMSWVDVGTCQGR